MAAGDFRVALDGSFYYGASGSQASTEAVNVENVVLNLSPQTAQALQRGKTYTMNKVIALDATLSFDVWDIEGDGLVSAIETAVTGKSRIALYPTGQSSGKGLDADYYITGFSRNETDLTKISVEAKPTDEERDPSYA